jgi:hypothetical protein
MDLYSRFLGGHNILILCCLLVRTALEKVLRFLANGGSESSVSWILDLSMNVVLSFVGYAGGVKRSTVGKALWSQELR